MWNEDKSNQKNQNLSEGFTILHAGTLNLRLALAEEKQLVKRSFFADINQKRLQ